MYSPLSIGAPTLDKKKKRKRNVGLGGGMRIVNSSSGRRKESFCPWLDFKSRDFEGDGRLFGLKNLR